MRRDDQRQHSDDPWPMQQVTYAATRLLRKGFRSERARTSMEDYYKPRNNQRSSLDEQQLPTKPFPSSSVCNSLTTDIQESTELPECMQHEQMPMTVSASHTQPPSSPEKMASEGPSTNYIEKAADAPCFKMEESTSGTSELLTTELQEAPKLEQVEPVLVEEPLVMKVPIGFEANDNTQRGFLSCSHQVSLMATGVLLQESYLRGQGNERSGLGVPAVSKDTHQLTDDLFVSKIPLEFETERLEEQPKHTRVEVEELEMLAGSPEAKRLADKGIIDSHRAPQRTNHTGSKVVARRIRIEKPSRLIARRKLPDEFLPVEMLKHTARIDDLALEIFWNRAVPVIYILFKDSSSESTRALDVGTCTESPAVLTKRSHVTALRVVATRTQVLHIDASSIIGRLRKIAAIEGYEEWGERHTICELLWLRAMATTARTTSAVTRATAKTTTTLLSAGKMDVRDDARATSKQP
ncbi:hypothetical protein F5J12DRAFT_238979 [Pisolithus orientalis]|uniref:uncharacterized protein n=1 Tax=Pisolithus orientalis TaxID=936130 RepID=UPI0022252C29|nr:uncharacterized protein F5J12DRAFT_238979 [Pisolithus orientalis]KAI6001612.1 hypothetical protein F5J12DRAFT_238979 [Pisolithus orientalis]